MTTCPNCAEPPDAAVRGRPAGPDRGSLVAVSVTVPWATPWARPPDEIVATAVLLDAQATVRPVRMFPFASLSVAVNCADDPAATEAEAGDTVTVATGAGVPLDDTVKLQSDIVPMLVIAPQSARAVAPLCSLRNAKPVPMVSSAPPAGVT